MTVRYLIAKAWQSVFDNKKVKIHQITHPDYDAAKSDWIRYRYTFEGGRPFINKYLKKFSRRENTVDFSNRRQITYCPAHAKAAILEIKNSIYQRLVDVERKNGPRNYQQAVDGENHGVDFTGNTMNGFIGRLVLPELLSMAKVGVYVDKAEQDVGADVNETRGLRPYIYMYKTEAIRSWRINQEGILLSLLLKDTNETIEESTGLIKTSIVEYRHLKLLPENGGIQVDFYNTKGEKIINRSKVLDLPIIPFVIFELSQSLLTDVADYQVALLNMGSSDINYSLKANFPFYTEQFDAAAEMPFVRQATIAQPTEETTGTSSETKPGESAEAQKAKPREMEAGTTAGRRYPKGLDRPGFIHPSAEPLRASMEKQKSLREEIKQLVNLNVMTLVPMRASAEARDSGDKSLEAGLSYIGMELQYGEKIIADIWSAYEGSKEEVKITYPDNYSLRTDKDRREETKELTKEMPQYASITYQKETAKRAITILMGHKVDRATLKKMHDEIDASEVAVVDPKTIRDDHDAGLVSDVLASKLRGYPEGEVAQAQKDHSARAARILKAQTQARGVDDLGNDPDASKKEKEGKQQRGKGEGGNK